MVYNDKKHRSNKHLKLAKAKLINVNAFRRYPWADFNKNYILTSGNYASASTHGGVKKFWSADFEGGRKKIEKVHIRARNNCCPNRLKGVKIFIDRAPCGEIPKDDRQFKNG